MAVPIVAEFALVRKVQKALSEDVIHELSHRSQGGKEEPFSCGDQHALLGTDALLGRNHCGGQSVERAENGRCKV